MPLDYFEVSIIRIFNLFVSSHGITPVLLFYICWFGFQGMDNRNEVYIYIYMSQLNKETSSSILMSIFFIQKYSFVNSVQHNDIVLIFVSQLRKYLVKSYIHKI